jgi:hypothetical protein
MFSKPPIGPVGAHLSLTDKKWATAGEVVLGKCLELWIVDNARDNNVRGVLEFHKSHIPLSLNSALQSLACLGCLFDCWPHQGIAVKASQLCVLLCVHG